MSTPVSRPDLLADDSRGRGVTALYWVLTAISGIVLILRFWARCLRKAIGVDDWLMFACWVDDMLLFKGRVIED